MAATITRREGFASLSPVVPANAGTHTPCPLDVAKRILKSQLNGVWVPAFAGTTKDSS